MASLVIPAHNEEASIAACLTSAEQQTEPFDEIIVVDNASTDGTLRAIKTFPRVRVLSEHRVGVQHARDTGMDAARGTVIARIDADTRLPPDWSQRVRAAFADPAVQAVTGPGRYYDVALASLINLGEAAIRRAWSARMDWIWGANMAVRASAWRAVRPSLCLTADAHEDTDLGIHLHAAGLRIAYLPHLRIGTSARRIADRYPAFRSYLLMSEAAYRRHRDLTATRSYVRAWLTTRLLLAGFLPLRLAHAIHVGGRLRGRKNPMAPNPQPRPELDGET